MVIGKLMIFTDGHITVIGFFLVTCREYFKTLFQSSSDFDRITVVKAQ